MERIELAKQSARYGMEVFLRNFSHVPDDKLEWSPAPTAKSALRVAAHTALYAGRFAQMIRNRELPRVESLDAWLAQREAEELAVTGREDVVRIFQAGTDEAIAAMDSLSAEELDSRLDSGMGWSMPMSHLIDLPGWHATLHTGQIDFLQTCWGDQEIYV